MSSQRPHSRRFPGWGWLPRRAALLHDPLPIGAVAVGLTVGTYGLFGVPVDLPLLIAALCGTTLVYLVERTCARPQEDELNHPKRVAWVEAHEPWIAVEAALLLAGLGTAVFYLKMATLLWSCALGAVAALHVLPSSGQPLKAEGMSKPVAIAGAWAVGSAVLPVVEAGMRVDDSVVLLAVCRLLFVLPNLLVADWRDRRGDAASGGTPWAVRWTEAEVRWAATGLLVAALAGAGTWGVNVGVPLLAGVDAVGPLLMLGVVWGLDIESARSALVADLVVGWPAVTYFASQMIV